MMRRTFERNWLIVLYLLTIVLLAVVAALWR